MIGYIHHSTVLGNIGDRYPSYCTTYKSHAMTSHHGGAGHSAKDRDLDSHTEFAGNIDIGPNHDSESTNSSDTTVAFGGSEADGSLGNLLPNSQADLNILPMEINSL